MSYPTRDEVKKRGTPIIDDDDNGSIDLRPAKANPTCGACRTRDSKVWWKAPKGLSTNILCERCGPNWRRYADLNVRPVREESIPSTKRKAAEESRDGTPINGPIAKRVKVRQVRLRYTCRRSLSCSDAQPCASYSTSIQSPPIALSCLPQEWSSRQGC